MPQPVSISIQLGVNDLGERPELAVMIAKIILEWSKIEEQLATIFAHGLHGEPAISHALLSCTSNLATRLSMIQTALTLGCSEAAGKEFAKDVVPKVRKAAKWRNKIAHGIWTIHEKYPDDLIWCAGTMSPTLASERYTKKDFLELWLRLLKAHEFLLTYALALPVRYPRRASEDPVPFWRPADSEASAESIADREG